MTKRWRGFLAGAGVGLAALASGPSVRPVAAQAPPRTLDLAGMSAVDRAFQDTQATGRPTVLAVTSKAHPAARQAWAGLLARPSVRPMGRFMNFVELISETDPIRVQHLGVRSVPTILVYRRGAQGPELAGAKAGAIDPATTAAWLGFEEAPAATAAASAPVDPAVARASHHATASGQEYPSQQAPSLPPQAPQMPQAPVMAPQPVMVPASPVYSAPSGPAAVVSTPSAPLFIQQQPQTIVMSPPAAPNVIMGAPAAPTTNMFMAPQPVQQPMAPAAMPMAPTMMVPAQPSQPQSAVGTAVVGLLLENPSLIRQILGALGRFLSRFGNPTVRMTNMPQMTQMPVATALPAAPAQQPVYAIPQPPAAPEAPTPSPQSAPPRKHGFFHRY